MLASVTVGSGAESVHKKSFNMWNRIEIIRALDVTRHGIGVEPQLFQYVSCALGKFSPLNFAFGLGIERFKTRSASL